MSWREKRDKAWAIVESLQGEAGETARTLWVLASRLRRLHADWGGVCRALTYVNITQIAEETLETLLAPEPTKIDALIERVRGARKLLEKIDNPLMCLSRPKHKALETLELLEDNLRKLKNLQGGAGPR